MHDLPTVRSFRLSRGGIECDEQGLRVGDRALLTRDEEGVWAARDERGTGCEPDRSLACANDEGISGITSDRGRPRKVEFDRRL